MTETTPTKTATMQTPRARHAPVPPAEVVATPPHRLRCAPRSTRAVAEIDLDDSNSILFFGTSAQAEVTSVADEMLEGVRNKDTGPAGTGAERNGVDAARLRRSTISIRRNAPGSSRACSAGQNRSRRCCSSTSRCAAQIDSISNRLDGHTSTLMKDIGMLDRLYDKTLGYFHSLATYIAAGEEWLRRLDTEQLPALQKDAEASSDVLKAQAVRDLRAKRDDLERRVHDLKLTRQVTMQSLPSIRLVQENDKALVGKIGSTMANTIPLWRQQLAMAVTIARSAEAGDTLKQATDLTNELLTANADTLRTSTQAIRTQIERGVVDIAAVKQANDALIATIDDALRIADDGKRQRVEAEKTLIACEAELKQALSSAKARAPQPAR